MSVKRFDLNDIIGKKFKKLTILSYEGSNGKTPIKHLYKCLCDCGNITVKVRTNILTNHTQSCGCLKTIKGKDHKDWAGYGDLANRKWNSYIIKAKSRNLIFDITIEYAWNLFIEQNKKCALSGIDISINSLNTNRNINKNPTRKKIYPTASLDRINNNLGYIEGNVQWVHKDLNWMKGTFDQDRFIELCTLVSNKNKK